MSKCQRYLTNIANVYALSVVSCMGIVLINNVRDLGKVWYVVTTYDLQFHRCLLFLML